MQYTNPDKELQAYIYQQVSELEPFLVPNTQVNVLVHNEEKEKSVRLSASVPEGVIEAEVADADVYKAIRDAKKVLLYQIDEINNSTDSIRTRPESSNFHGRRHSASSLIIFL